MYIQTSFPCEIFFTLYIGIHLELEMNDLNRKLTANAHIN